jgi:hypothetical protein
MTMGMLTKLSIQAYKTIKFLETVGEPFVTMFNPEKYDETYEINYKDDQAQGTSANAPKFEKMKPQEYQFEFLVDGTGASGELKDVDTEIKHFLSVVYEYNGDEHRPNFCMLHWGRLLVKCNLKTCAVSYTLFDTDGYPLRARIKATFVEVKSDEIRVREQADNSPDMTHVRRILPGDTLAMMSYKIYGDVKYYPLLARHNGLISFQTLEPGMEVVLPPLETLLLLNQEEGERLNA